jgi:hypothetical protein
MPVKALQTHPVGRAGLLGQVADLVSVQFIGRQCCRADKLEVTTFLGSSHGCTRDRLRLPEKADCQR